MGAQKGVVGDGPRLSKGVEFIEPLSRDVELEQTVLLHAGQGHDLLTLSHSLLTAFPGAGKGNSIWKMHFQVFCAQGGAEGTAHL